MRKKMNQIELAMCNNYINDYVQNNGSFIKSYMDTLGISGITWKDTKAYKKISNKASTIFNRPEVKEYLSSHISLQGLNLQFVNLKLSHLIANGKENIALNAIKLYHQLYEDFKEKIEISNDNIDLSKLTDEELTLYLSISKKIKGE